MAISLVSATPARGQNEVDDPDGVFPGPWSNLTDCTLTVLNRSVPYVPGMPFQIPNIPSVQGPIRLRVTCNNNGTLFTGISDFVQPVAGGIITVPEIRLGVTEPIPTSIRVTSSAATLTAPGQMALLQVLATMPDGSARDLTNGASGTSYLSSNPAVATVTADGVATAVGSGAAVISALNEGTVATALVLVALNADADADGLPDDYERANGLNPANGADANLDPDGDGLTSFREFQIGTAPFVADTDGDGLRDDAEASGNTNPVLADTDVDGLVDGQEITRGTDPNRRDTDGDGLTDGLEVRLALNPLSTNSDGDAIPDGQEDSDSDGLVNIDELELYTDAGNPDTDGDGTSDGREVLFGCDPVVAQVTFVTGRAIDANGSPLAAADIRSFGRRTQTAGDGTFAFQNFPVSCPARDIHAAAFAHVGSGVLRGISGVVEGVAEGETSLGDIVMTPFAVDFPLPYPSAKFEIRGVQAREMATGDLNGDGRADVVVGNSSISVQGAVVGVAVMISRGDGSYEPEQRYPAGGGQTFGGPGPYAVAIGDVNHDGRLDVVTANRDVNTVSVLLGNGDGTLQPQQVFPVAGGPIAITLADMDADDNLDILTANTTLSADTASVLRGSGSGSFSEVRRIPVGINPVGVAAVDINGDSALDVLVANNFSGDVSVVLRDNTGGYLPEFRVSMGSGSFPAALAVADIDGDAAVDVVVAGSQNVSVALGTGSGLFQSARQSLVGLSANGMALADIDADGALDVVVASSERFAMLAGLADGTFGPPVIGAIATPSSAVLRRVNITDTNGDSVPDLLLMYTGGGISDVTVNLGLGDGTFEALSILPVGTANQNPKAPSVGDLNRDGIQDLVIMNATLARVAVRLGAGGGTFLPETSYAALQGAVGTVLGDANGDGVLDVFAPNSGNSFETPARGVSLLIGRGDGSFEPVCRIVTGKHTRERGLALADFNRDGRLDLVAASSTTAELTIALGGGGTCASFQVTGTLNGTVNVVAAGDFNGDGRPDIAGAGADSSGSAVHVWLGLGTGAFSGPASFTIPDVTSQTQSAIVIADINMDARADIIVGTSSLGAEVAVLLGNGNGTFQPARRFGAVPNAQTLVTADVNADSIPDVIVGGRDVVVLLGTGDGDLQPAMRFAAGAEPKVGDVADVNGDGRPDIPVANAFRGTATILFQH